LTKKKVDAFPGYFSTIDHFVTKEKKKKEKNTALRKRRRRTLKLAEKTSPFPKPPPPSDKKPTTTEGTDSTRKQSLVPPRIWRLQPQAQHQATTATLNPLPYKPFSAPRRQAQKTTTIMTMTMTKQHHHQNNTQHT
jgi:hypothetical protein